MTKEFEEKLRKFIRYTDKPLYFAKAQSEFGEHICEEATQAIDLRHELIRLLDAPARGSKWRQTTLEELIENEQRQV